MNLSNIREHIIKIQWCFVDIFIGANSEQAKKNRNGYEAGKTEQREATHISKKRKFNACYVNHDF